MCQIAEAGGRYWYTRGINWRAVAAWLVGFVVFDWAKGWPGIGYFAGLSGTALGGEGWSFGASLPCIVVTAAAYLIFPGIFGRGTRERG